MPRGKRPSVIATTIEYRRRTSYEIIWSTVRLIPKGKVATYGEVAEQSGLPGHARLVGYALHALPEDSDVPWHRVVNARGTISLPPSRASASKQRMLLKREGVQVHNGKMDLKRFGWLRTRST
jgi:methylated-DNA-protein-cysteine methyltransferase-like protein